MDRLYTAQNLEISYDSQSRIMYCNWIGSQERDIIIKSGGVMLDLLRIHGINKILNDNTLVVGPWWEAAVWAADEWFPKMIENGLTHFAWVLSPNIFTELSARRAMQPYGKIVNTFHSWEEARKWLLIESVPSNKFVYE